MIYLFEIKPVLDVHNKSTFPLKNYESKRKVRHHRDYDLTLKCLVLLIYNTLEIMSVMRFLIMLYDDIVLLPSTFAR